ncbi:MAG: hypothetical protein ACREEE_04835 [Dongiaceae bacterium]
MRKLMMAALAAASWPAPAAAQGIPANLQVLCGQYQTAVRSLAETWHESTAATGVQSGHQVELWVSPGGDTWTILVRMSNDMSCTLATGENWQPILDAVPQVPL